MKAVILSFQTVECIPALRGLELSDLKNVKLALVF